MSLRSLDGFTTFFTKEIKHIIVVFFCAKKKKEKRKKRSSKNFHWNKSRIFIFSWYLVSERETFFLSATTKNASQLFETAQNFFLLFGSIFFVSSALLLLFLLSCWKLVFFGVQHETYNRFSLWLFVETVAKIKKKTKLSKEGIYAYYKG